MAKIMCKINLGTVYQNLYKETQIGQVEVFSLPLEKIPSFIAKQEDVKDVYISGLNKSFLEKIESDTKILTYDNNNKIFHYT